MLLFWSDAATTGTFALVGALIGALAGALVHWSFELRRERGDLLQAQRLVGEEMLLNFASLNMVLVEERLPTHSGTGPTLFLSDGVWREYRATLARHLSADDYSTVMLAMVVKPHLRELIARTAGEPPSDKMREQVRHERAQTGKAYQVLTGGPPPAVDTV
jgi:hypothetical protein